MKKSIKILYVFLCIVTALSTVIFATNIDGVSVAPKTTGNGVTTVQTVGNSITGIIKVIGIFVSVAMLMVIGVKYMMGSAEEKAEYKKVMIPWIIGAVLLFAASAFADQIAAFATSIFGNAKK